MTVVVMLVVAVGGLANYVFTCNMTPPLVEIVYRDMWSGVGSTTVNASAPEVQMNGLTPPCFIFILELGGYLTTQYTARGGA